MAFDARRRAGGHRIRRTLPGGGGATATAYTTGLSSSSGSVGSAVVMTFTPSEGGWPGGEVITPTVSGVAGTFAPATINASGSGAVTCAFTPSAAGTASLSSTAAPALTNATGAQSYTVSSAATPPALTGFSWTQYQPLSSQSDMPWATLVGEVVPAGGVGPFTYEIVTNPNNYELGRYNNKRGIIATPYIPAPPATSDTIAVKVTDNSGSTFTGNVVIDRTATLPAVFVGPLKIPNNQGDGFYGFQINFHSVGSGHDDNDSVTVTSDPSGQFSFSYGALRANSVLAIGSYPITVQATGAGGTITKSFTLQVTNGAITGPIYFTPSLVSTSMTAGSQVGKAACTTPNNGGSWSIDDPSGTFQVDGSGYISVRTSPTLGAKTFSLIRTEGPASYSQDFTITVVQGTTLPAGNMTMAPSASLVNVGRGQTVGTPSVSGVTGTKQWSLTQENYSLQAIPNGYIGYLFAIDPATGAITAPGLLMAKTHKLIVSCTDGTNTCTQTFNVPVAWAPVVRTVWVGQGMTTAHGADGFEHLVDARDVFNTDRRTGTIQLNLVANADDDYYADDTGIRTGDYSARFPWQGPIIVTGIAANGKAQPRTGGYTTKWSNSGGDMRGKGFWVFGDGDAILENVEVSHCFGGDSAHGIEAVRKDGETYGNLTVRNCYIHDCDNGIETGFGGSDIILYGNEVVGCGTSHVSSGACHNFYIGGQWSVTAHDNVSASATLGHDFKCRAVHGDITNNRFYDLERGSASCCMDLPNGGDYRVTNNAFHKGPNAANPYAVQYAAEFDPTLPDWRTNNLLFQGNTVSVMTLDGAHYGTPAAVRHWEATSYFGDPTTVQVVGNSFWLAPHATTISSTGGGTTPTARTAESGSTILTTPPTLDFSRPYLSGTMPRHGWYRTITQYGGDSFANFDDTQIDPGFDDLVIPSSTAAGTVLGTMQARANFDDNGGPAAQPFGAGTTWVLSTANVYYPENLAAPWPPAGTFTLTTQADGSAKFSVGSTGLSSGVYFVQPEATAPNATKSRWRFYVTVT